MLKPFYLNSDYQFDFKGNCSYKGQMLKNLEDQIEISVYGKNQVFDRKNIGLYTHFRMNPFQIPFDSVEYTPVTSRVLRFVCGHIPIFKEPIEVGYGFRIIPGFPNFAINEKGDILSFKTGHILAEQLNAYGYRDINVFDPDKERWRRVTLHLLLARAFIKNKDPSNKFYVNHKDGNKLNISLDNLEWCSPKENSEHAMKLGLVNLTGLEKGRKTSPVTVHDLITGEKFDYPSITLAVEANKISKNWSGETKTINGISYSRVYRKRYVVTDLGQPLPNDNLWLNGFPGARVPNKGPYQALEINTGIVINCDMIKELVMATNVPYHHVTAILDSDIPKKSNGYYFRTISDKPWPSEFTDLLQIIRKSFKVVNRTTDEEVLFDSLKDITEYLSVASDTVFKFIRKEKQHPVYEIEEIT